MKNRNEFKTKFNLNVYLPGGCFKEDLKIINY